MAVFVAVAEMGSFTAAARKLGLAKSGVSRLVSELEHQLGLSLFSRTTRHIALTELGAAYYESCARMVGAAEDATATLRDFQAAPTGRLRITTAIGLAPYVLPVLAELANAHHDLRFDVRLEDHYANLIEEDIDVAVRGGHLQDSTLIARAIASVVHVVCAAPSYLERRGIPRSPPDLARYDWIRVDGVPAQLVVRAGDRVARINVRAKWHVNTGLAALALLRDGQGMTLAPLWDVVDDLRAGRLRVVLASYEFKSSSVYLVSPAGRQRLPKVVTFAKRLAEHLKNTQWDYIDPLWIAKSNAESGSQRARGKNATKGTRTRSR